MTETRTTSHDPRVDTYIAHAPAYAQPILAHLREVVHSACPDVVETTKWSRPFFDYRGSPLCFMSAFKAHCGFGFWRGKELDGVTHRDGGDGMGHFGRLTSLADLPPTRDLVACIEAAMKLSENDAKPARPKAVPKADVELPDDLANALDDAPAAATHFAAFSPSARREYIEWIVEAKRQQTRATRVATTVAWSIEGKTRNWKYR